MTRDEAIGLLDKLQSAFDKTLEPKTFGLYTKYLVQQPISIATRAIDEIIRSSRYFPKVADILSSIKNNLRTSDDEDDRQTSIWDLPYGRWLMYRQRCIEKMGRDSYGQYCLDNDFRNAQDDAWHRTWLTLMNSTYMDSEMGGTAT